MNKYLLSTLLLLLVLAACQKEIEEEPAPPFLRTDSTSLTLPAEASKKDSFKISSNLEWNIRIDPATADWLSVNITSGKGNTLVIVTVAKPNTSDTIQKATITISPVKDTTQKPVVIQVSQNKPVVKMRNVYGGTELDEFFSVVAMADGGFIAVGRTISNNGDVSGLHGRWEDAWIIRIAANGDKVWQKAIGGTDRDGAWYIGQASDGNYLVLAGGESRDGDFAGSNGGGYLFKIDGNGAVLLKKQIGDQFHYANSIAPATGGGYIITGGANPAGFSDVWVAKLNDQGDQQWEKTYGGSWSEGAAHVVTASDGGYIIAGGTQSTDGDVTGNHGGDDAWIIKIDDNGNKVWQKTYGGSGGDGCSYIAKTSDGGYVIAGATGSNDGDVSGNHGSSDYWLYKINATGALVWQKTFGGPDTDVAMHMIPTADGGFVVTGYSRSSTGDITNFRGQTDTWVVKIDGNGNKIWQRALGGTDEDYGDFILEYTAGKFVVVGTTYSDDLDIVGLHGYGDAWLMRFE